MPRQNLAGEPRCGRVAGNVEVDDLATIVYEDERDKQQPKRRRGNHEKVDGGDASPEFSALLSFW